MSNYKNIKNDYPLIIKALENARNSNRLAHAFLIQSDSEENRNKFALALAQIGCCPNAKDGVPCDVCNVCNGMNNDNYPDMAKVTPEGKAFFIKVGDTTNPETNTIRGFCETFYLSKINNAEKKIGIIYEADRMNTEAQNALLKTLEEPPKDSLIIMLSAKAKTLLPTTISRCHLLNLPEKKIEFNFNNTAELFAELWSAYNANDDLVKLESAASKIIDIAAKLKDEASSENESKYSAKIENAKEFDEKLVKRLTVMMEENAVGVYIGKRERFLSAIHTFFSQLLLLKSGANLDDLANKDIFSNLENLDIKLLNEQKLIKAVALADKLIYSFKFFVNEPLAIRNFIFNI